MTRPKDLNPMSIYLAGPCDGITTEEARDWREDIMLPTNVVAFSPPHAFMNSSKAVAREINHILRHVMVACDGTLAKLDGPGAALGTIREIEFAKMNRQPVAIACSEELEKSLMTFDLLCFRTVDEALTGLLDAIRSGRREQGPVGLLAMLPGMIPPQDDDEEDQ